MRPRSPAQTPNARSQTITSAAPSCMFIAPPRLDEATRPEDGDGLDRLLGDRDGADDTEPAREACVTAERAGRDARRFGT